jgi:hypothetical protein
MAMSAFVASLLALAATVCELRSMSLLCKRISYCHVISYPFLSSCQSRVDFANECGFLSTQPTNHVFFFCCFVWWAPGKLAGCSPHLLFILTPPSSHVADRRSVAADRHMDGPDQHRALHAVWLGVHVPEPVLQPCHLCPHLLHLELQHPLHQHHRHARLAGEACFVGCLLVVKTIHRSTLSAKKKCSPSQPLLF